MFDYSIDTDQQWSSNPQEVVYDIQQLHYPEMDFGLEGENVIPVKFIKPKPMPPNNYASLDCDEEDKQAIHTIITNMAYNGKGWLFAHQTEMNLIGDSVRHVHPLKFLEVVFSDETLKECMGDIFKSYFKRTGFMRGLLSSNPGLAQSLSTKHQLGEVEKYLYEFAKAINTPAESIIPFVRAEDWEGLVRFLISH